MKDLHFVHSIIKSILRILGCFAFYKGNMPLGGILFGIAEIFGITEEIDWKKYFPKI